VQSRAFAGGDPFRGPWKTAQADHVKKANPPVEGKTGGLAVFQKIAVKSVVFFQKRISSTDGDRCPLVPSCSAYGKQAIEKHGVALGTIMTAARLTHERGEIKFSPMVKTAKGYRFYDPVEHNDFWFSDSSGRLPEQGTPNE
jgi:hypothetical protein